MRGKESILMMQRYEKHENQMKNCATCAHETDSK